MLTNIVAACSGDGMVPDLALRPTYEVRIGGEKADVRRHLFTPLREKFTIDVPGPDDMEMRGNPFEHEFTTAVAPPAQISSRDSSRSSSRRIRFITSLDRAPSLRIRSSASRCAASTSCTICW